MLLSFHAANERRLGDIQAKELFHEALELDLESIEIQNNYSNLLIDIGDFTTARSLLEKLLCLNPDYQDAKVILLGLKSFLVKLHQSL